MKAVDKKNRNVPYMRRYFIKEIFYICRSRRCEELPNIDLWRFLIEITTMDNRKKFNAMEKPLQEVSGQYVSVPKYVKTKNNRILKQVFNTLIQKMKKHDQRFSQLYQKAFFGGSYYDGLKMGTPDEYDIDLLLKFPSSHTLEIRTGKLPAFVHLYLNNKVGFANFCDDGKWNMYLDTKKVLSWMEGVIQKAFDNCKSTDSGYLLGQRQVMVRKTNGPAFTLTIKAKNENEVDMDVDLVPCFLFNEDKWPPGFRKYKTNNKAVPEFFVVPKHPKGVKSDLTKYWRLSFQIQEREIILNKGFLKPALKLLKKMRDVQQHTKMYSYFLKTMILWEVENNEESFWKNNSLSYIFMHILKKCQKCLENGTIQYFWTIAKFNLLETAQADWDNISNRLYSIINKIEINIQENPRLIQQYILTPDEQAGLEK